MRIGTKIFLPYLALLLLIGGVGGYILVSFGSLQEKLTEGMLREEHVNARVNELNSLDRDTENNLLSYQFDHDPKHLSSIDRVDKDATEILRELRSITVTTKGLALLQEYEASRKSLFSVRGDLIAALQGKDQAALRAAFDRWSVHSADTHAQLLDLILYKRALLEETIDSGQATNEQLRRLILGLLVISFGVMFLASTYHSISIIRPIKRLKDHTERIAQGDLYHTALLRARKDEIGQLASSFRDMTLKLRQSQEALELRVLERTQELLAAKDRIEEEVSNVRKFQQAVESSFDAVFMTAETPGIVYVNPAWERLTGFGKEEMVGEDPWIFMSARTDLELRAQLEKAMSQSEPFYTEDIVARRKNGTEFEMELTVYPIQDKDGTVFLVGVGHDISKRRRLDRAKTDFVSLASHQLRTPLTGIRWALGRLHKVRDTLTDSQQQMLAAARGATARMAETIDTMLTISRIEAERIEIKPWDLRLSIFLTNLIHESEHLYRQKHQSVQLSCGDDLRLRTDPNVLHEVLTNLLTNAIKYTPERGRIAVRAEQQGEWTRLEVQDSGYGIPLDQQHKVFSKFFRGDNIVQNDPDGTGLGLYLVYALVRLIGGTISFVSEENRGTTFTIHLPISPPPYGQNGPGR